MPTNKNVCGSTTKKRKHTYAREGESGSVTNFVYSARSCNRYLHVTVADISYCNLWKSHSSTTH